MAALLLAPALIGWLAAAAPAPAQDVVRIAAVVNDDVITLHDLESTNGVFTQIEGEVELRSGDEIRIGGQLFRFDT